MSVTYEKETGLFKLDTPNSSYIMAIVDEEAFLGHVYYGKRLLSTRGLDDLARINEPPFVPSKNNRDRLSFYDCFPFEYPVFGLGDFRESCLSVKSTNGHRGCKLSYKSHKIYPGKYTLDGLPCCQGKETDCTSLEIKCIDPLLNLEITLFYGVYHHLDTITRAVKITNRGNSLLTIEKGLSSCLSLEGNSYEAITLHGSWARERHIQRNSVQMGSYSIGSVRGESSHQANPFMALAAPHTTDEQGEVYGMNLVYSGNFLAAAEVNQFETTRMLMGLHPQGFEWQLNSEETLVLPECVHVYSSCGIGRMTRTFHDLYRNHLIRNPNVFNRKPVLINSWEASYFDINDTQLIDMAKSAAELGVDLFVMDDGWFGKRNDDNTSLGDWQVNTDKIQCGLAELVKQINDKGMEFGIWFEPEMVSPNSELYRRHPDWAIAIPGRTAGLCRNQYVLDLSRGEVRDYIFQSLCQVLDSAPIRYVKWDMNRQLADLGSARLDSNRQGELYHRYVLGVYELMERLITRYPKLLLENCSGGGARFDPGMLYYSPRIWASDDTDSIERLAIQEGTALVYPISCIGSHVSICPNHTVHRITPLSTRGNVAMAGTFGYELDPRELSEKEKEEVKKQIRSYKSYAKLIQTGDYFRLSSFQENGEIDGWMIVSKNKQEALITFVQGLARPNYHSRRIRLKGLNPHQQYKDSLSGIQYSGDGLMYAGINWLAGKDFDSKVIHLLAL